MIKGIKSVLGFLTVLPVGMSDLESTARSVWAFPLVGALIALIAAFSHDLLTNTFPVQITSAFVLFVLLALAGFHHLDGLLDFGDAAMHIGTHKERLKAMRDVNIGAGGFAFGFFMLLATYAALTKTTQVYTTLIAAETSAKFAMVFSAFAGAPSHEGTGSVFTKEVTARRFLAALAIYLALMSILPPVKIIAVVAATLSFPLVITGISTRLFGGVSGDVFGAINEITRLLVLLVLVA